MPDTYYVGKVQGHHVALAKMLGVCHARNIPCPLMKNGRRQASPCQTPSLLANVGVVKLLGSCDRQTPWADGYLIRGIRYQSVLD